jgi:hypothetical protein
MTTPSHPVPTPSPEAFPDDPAPRPSPIGGRGRGRLPSHPVPTPCQLEPFDRFDDGLDFGAWMERLPLDPQSKR